MIFNLCRCAGGGVYTAVGVLPCRGTRRPLLCYFLLVREPSDFGRASHETVRCAAAEGSKLIRSLRNIPVSQTQVC